jgi:threonine aldolase
LWKKNASHANKMAQLLEEKLQHFEQVKVTRKVEANGVFAIIPKKVLPNVQKEYFFHVWDEKTSEVRLMCSWDTTPEDIEGFAAALRKWVK